MPGAFRGGGGDDAPSDDQAADVAEEVIEEVSVGQAQDASPADGTGADEAVGQEKED